MASRSPGLVEQRFPNLTVDSLVGNLPELLISHLTSGRRAALLIEVGRSRYVQAMATEKQELIIECVSNRYLEGADQLDLNEELSLMSIGFHPPETISEPHPNWWWQCEGLIGVLEGCRLVEFVLLNTFGLARKERITLIERPLRRCHLSQGHL